MPEEASRNKKQLSDRSRRIDSAILSALVFLSALPYLFRIGFYGDDWGYQATLAHFSGQGFRTTVRELLNWDSGMLVRPVQIAYLVLGFKVFGRHPLPYHLFNTLVLCLVTVLLYLAIRELRRERYLAFVIAIVFGLLPHYTVNRFWISSHQATLSLAFALLGIYALLRLHRADKRNLKWWTALATVSMVLSLLAYEMTLGLIVAAVGVIGWWQYREARRSTERDFTRLAGTLAVTAVLFLAGMVKILKQTRFTYHHHFFSRLGPLTWHALAQAVKFNLWTYGLHMPAVLAGLYRHSAFGIAAVATSLLMACLAAFYISRIIGDRAMLGRKAWLGLFLLGFVLFALGYGLNFGSLQIDMAVAGDNRVGDSRLAMPAAIGASCVLVAAAGLVCSALRSPKRRAQALSVTVGLICGVNCLAVSGIASFWIDASAQQSRILRSLAANVPTLPKGSVLLLDGFCRYSGPATVFESNWDVMGPVQLTLGDYSLMGDVVTPELRFGPAGVEHTENPQPDGPYRYGSQLFIYNVQKQIFANLPSQQAAISFLRANDPTHDSGCAPGEDVSGATIF